MGDVWALLTDTCSAWYADRAQRLGAALAFYTIFAITPGLVIVMAVAGLLLGPGAESQIIDQVHELIGEQGASAIEAIVRSARAAPPRAAGMAVAFLTLVFGLWGVFGELQDGLNTIWGVTPRPGRRVVDMVRDRFWSFTLVVGIGFLLLVSLVLSAWLAALGTYMSYLLPAPAWALETLNFAISLTAITGAFALIFKVLPDVRIAWRDVWLGAAVTSLFFTVGKFLIGLYLGRSAVASAYGAAGSLVIIVVWVYYSAQILLFGAEFTKVWTKRRGSGFQVERTANAVTAEARAGRASRTYPGRGETTHLTEEPEEPTSRFSSLSLIAFIVLIVAWALGWFAFHVAGGLIHILLVVALISLIVHFVRGRP